MGGGVAPQVVVEIQEGSLTVAEATTASYPPSWTTNPYTDSTGNGVQNALVASVELMELTVELDLAKLIRTYQPGSEARAI